LGTLGVLGCQPWVDSLLHGGQEWWDAVLQQIAECDVFVAIISRDALNSIACRREFDWAEALGKPVLPVAVEPPPKALPRRISIRQIVDYSDPGHRTRAALTLAGGPATLPQAPPLPEPLPEAPAVPLSYLTDLVDLVNQPDPLDHDLQRQIVFKLEPALRSNDLEERRGGRDILEAFSCRDDLYADVDRMIKEHSDTQRIHSPRNTTHAGTRPPRQPGPPVPRLTPQHPQQLPRAPTLAATQQHRPDDAPTSPPHSTPNLLTTGRPNIGTPPTPWWQRQPRQVRFLLISAHILLAAAGISSLVWVNAHKPSPPPLTTTEASDLVAPPPADAASGAVPPAGMMAVTYTVTGTKGPGDIITVTFVDASGGTRTQQNVDLPWSLTLRLKSQSEVGPLQASSLFLVSKLNCSITTGNGTVLTSNTDNSSQISC
jgi:hypothetical protein